MIEIAKNEWIHLLSNKSYNAWKNEDQKFRKFAMLLSALNEEFAHIKNTVNNLKQNIDNVISLPCTSSNTDKMDDSEDMPYTATTVSSSLLTCSTDTTKSSCLSPDLFDNDDSNYESNNLYKKQELSPIIKSKNLNKIVGTRQKRNKLFDNVLDDDVVIVANTPIKERGQSIIHTVKKNCSNLQKQNMRNNVDNDITLMDITNSYKEAGTSGKSNSPKQSVNRQRMLLKTNVESCKNKSVEMSEEPKYAYVEKGIRGNARKKLEGWSCTECEKFYSGLNLDQNELKKLQNKCSRHRGKFAPIPCTPDGFWDLTFMKKN